MKKLFLVVLHGEVVKIYKTYDRALWYTQLHPHDSYQIEEVNYE